MGKSVRTRIKERLRSWRQRINGPPLAPAWVQVEINNTCNLRCVMCPRQAMKRAPRHMTVDEFCSIADKCRSADVPRLRLFLLGEPLLHPDLCQMIRYAKSIGVPSVELNTNAALLDADRTEELLTSGLDRIVFSLDGVDAQTYEAIRVGARFEPVMANVEAFCRRRAERGQSTPHITVQTLVLASTRDHIGEFRRRWEPLADAVEVQCIREYHGVEGLRTTQIQPDDELRPCPALWEYLVILADLRLVPCCVDINGDMSLGSIAHTDISTAWQTSPTLNALRRAHLRYCYDDFPLCRGCEFTNVSLLKRKAAEASLGQ